MKSRRKRAGAAVQLQKTPLPLIEKTLKEEENGYDVEFMMQLRNQIIDPDSDLKAEEIESNRNQNFMPFIDAVQWICLLE